VAQPLSEGSALRDDAGELALVLAPE